MSRLIAVKMNRPCPASHPGKVGPSPVRRTAEKMTIDRVLFEIRVGRPQWNYQGGQKRTETQGEGATPFSGLTDPESDNPKLGPRRSRTKSQNHDEAIIPYSRSRNPCRLLSRARLWIHSLLRSVFHRRSCPGAVLRRTGNLLTQDYDVFVRRAKILRPGPRISQRL